MATAKTIPAKEIRLRLSIQAICTTRKLEKTTTTEASSMCIRGFIHDDSPGKETLLINVFLRLRFDSSKGRGDFETPIGVGKVIKGIVDL